MKLQERGQSFCLLNLIAIVLTFGKSATGQHVSFGTCPAATGVKKFNVTAYGGLWYEVEKYWFLFETTTSCVRVNYDDSVNKDGSFAVEILQEENLTRKTFKNPGLTRFLSKDGSGNFALDVVITQSPIPFTVKYPYIVLGTDYSSFTIKWSCKQAGPMNIQNLWILSRSQTMPPASKDRVYSILKSLGISTQALQKSDLRSCPASL